MSEMTLDFQAGAGGFGDGAHPTTAMMIEVMRELAEDVVFENVLDMGCGSGLLSLVACRLWPECRVMAVDSQESAVLTAQENLRANGLQGRAQVIHGQGYRQQEAAHAAPFDLVLANIAADVHVGEAKYLPAVLAQDGLAVLSGILRWRMEELVALHDDQGLVLAAEPILQGDWCTLLLAKKL